MVPGPFHFGENAENFQGNHTIIWGTFVCSPTPDPWTDFHQAWYVCVGWPQNCPWGGSFGKGQGRWGKGQIRISPTSLGLFSPNLVLTLSRSRSLRQQGRGYKIENVVFKNCKLLSVYKNENAHSVPSIDASSIVNSKCSWEGGKLLIEEHFPPSKWIN
jgi:hypothetical protein